MNDGEHDLIFIDMGFVERVFSSWWFFAAIGAVITLGVMFL